MGDCARHPHGLPPPYQRAVRVATMAKLVSGAICGPTNFVVIQVFTTVPLRKSPSETWYVAGSANESVVENRVG